MKKKVSQEPIDSDVPVVSDPNPYGYAKPHIRTPYNAHRMPVDVSTGEIQSFDALFYEQGDPVSMTVPDQSLSVKEILRRYASGQPLGGQRVPVYEPDSDLPDPRRLDLAERQELAERYAKELKEIEDRKQKMEQAKQDADKAALEAQEEARYKRYLERQKADTPPPKG